MSELLLPARASGAENEPKQPRERIELIDGEPVISLETALRFLWRVQESFPEWLLHLSYDSRVEKTCQDAYSRYAKFVRSCLGIALDINVNDMTPQEQERYHAYTLFGIPDFRFWNDSIHNLDELRAQYPLESYAGYYLELQLALVRVRVKEALRPIHSRAFGPIDYGENPQVLNAFRQKFVEAMRALGIYYEPTKIAVVGVENAQVVSAEVIQSGMPAPTEDYETGCLPPLLTGEVV